MRRFSLEWEKRRNCLAKPFAKGRPTGDMCERVRRTQFLNTAKWNLSDKMLMTSVLFFPLLLFQIELTLFLCLTLFSADLFSFHFDFLPLHLQRLLGPGSNAGSTYLLPCFALPSFWVICGLFHLGFNRRAECQLTIVLENKLPDFIIFWLCPKGHLTYRQLAV